MSEGNMTGASRMRNPDHRFEWGIHKFQNWCGGVVARDAYNVANAAFKNIGGATQIAIFNKKDMT